MKYLEFSWKKLILLATLNILLSSIFIYFYRVQQEVFWLYFLFFTGIICTVIYLFMVYSMAPKNKLLIPILAIISLTPFLSLVLITYLWHIKNPQNNPYFSRYKIILLLVASALALTLNLKSTEFLSKQELLSARVLPPEISLLYLSYAEAKRVSALTPYDLATTPWAVSKIKKLRKIHHPDFSMTLGMNPNSIFKILPLGFAWIRGAPIHSLALIHFDQLQR